VTHTRVPSAILTYNRAPLGNAFRAIPTSNFRRGFKSLARSFKAFATKPRLFTIELYLKLFRIDPVLPSSDKDFSHPSGNLSPGIPYLLVTQIGSAVRSMHR
jgi:hypothetical protein